MTATYPTISKPRAGDRCEFVHRKGFDHALVRHFQCDRYTDGTITDPLAGVVVPANLIAI